MSDEIQEEHLEWPDVYFKAHKSPCKIYNPKVKPIINGSPTLCKEENMEFFRSLRDKEKTIDVSFMTKIWAGKERVVKMFEQLGQLKNSTSLNVLLHSRIPPKMNIKNGRWSEYIERIEDANLAIGVKNSFNDLWNNHASSKLVIIRHGKHASFSWGGSEQIAIGSCIVMDREIQSQFSVPFVKNINYLSLDLNIGEDAYEKIPEKIQGWLSQPELIQQISKNNCEYFDNHLSCLKVGEYINGFIK